MPNFYVIHFSFINDCYSQRIYMYLYINISLSCLRKLCYTENLSTIGYIKMYQRNALAEFQRGVHLKIGKSGSVTVDLEYLGIRIYYLDHKTSLFCSYQPSWSTKTLPNSLYLSLG